MRSTLAIVSATAVVVGVGVFLGVKAGTGAASSTFTVTPEQLQINQRISSAAVERSNTALNYLRPIRSSQLDTANNKGVQSPQNTQWLQAQIGTNAIGTNQIQNGAVTAAKLASGAIQPKLAVRTTTSGTIVPGNSTGPLTASCNTGEVATSGGFSAGVVGGGGNTVVVNAPTPVTPGSAPTGWTVNVFNNSGVPNTFTVYAICAAP
jgi:hypothetical protein